MTLLERLNEIEEAMIQGESTRRMCVDAVIGESIAEIERLSEDNKRLEGEAAEWRQIAIDNDMRQQLAEAQAEIAVLREALGYYSGESPTHGTKNTAAIALSHPSGSGYLKEWLGEPVGYLLEDEHTGKHVAVAHPLLSEKGYEHWTPLYAAPKGV
jgi:hypothetical protein